MILISLPPPWESPTRILEDNPEENVHIHYLHETVNMDEHFMWETVGPTSERLENPFSSNFNFYKNYNWSQKGLFLVHGQ